MTPVRWLQNTTVEWIKFRVLHVDDTPHRIALGASLGIFTAYMPPLGWHILILIFLAYLLRANKFVGLAMVWISNPLTLIPIYYPCYIVGRAVLSFFDVESSISPQEMKTILGNYSSASYVLSNIFKWHFWVQIWKVLMSIGLEIFIGGVIIGGCLGITVYFLTKKLVLWYRIHHPHRHLKNRSGGIPEKD